MKCFGKVQFVMVHAVLWTNMQERFFATQVLMNKLTHLLFERVDFDDLLWFHETRNLIHDPRHILSAPVVKVPIRPLSGDHAKDLIDKIGLLAVTAVAIAAWRLRSGWVVRGVPAFNVLAFPKRISVINLVSKCCHLNRRKAREKFRNLSRIRGGIFVYYVAI